MCHEHDAACLDRRPDAISSLPPARTLALGPLSPNPRQALGTRWEEKVRFRTARPCHPHPPHCWVQRWWLPAETWTKARLTFLVAVLLVSSLALLWGQLVLLLLPRLLRLFVWTGRGHVLCFTGRGGRGGLVLRLRGTVTDLRLHGEGWGQLSPHEPGPAPLTPHASVRPPLRSSLPSRSISGPDTMAQSRVHHRRRWDTG